jgi:hypothetical protein
VRGGAGTNSGRRGDLGQSRRVACHNALWITARLAPASGTWPRAHASFTQPSYTLFADVDPQLTSTILTHYAICYIIKDNMPVPESDVLKPIGPSVSEEYWPEFVLSDAAVVYESNGKPANLLLAYADVPLKVQGRLQAPPRGQTDCRRSTHDDSPNMQFLTTSQ